MLASPSDMAALERLDLQRQHRLSQDDVLLAYYQGRQRLLHLGMAIPPPLRAFVVIVNWPRVVVDSIVDRQQVKALYLPGQETADPQLRSIADASNLSQQLRMFNRDRCIFGRAFMSVQSTRDGGPVIRVESPREIAAEVDQLTERISIAARFFGVDDDGWGPTHATLYREDETRWFARRSGGAWRLIERDEHKLGAVPIVMHLNRRMSTTWSGESQMTDIIPLTDAAARALTNMQFTQEAHGAPRKFVTGAQASDFQDSKGNPVPKWEAYLDAIHILTKSDAKVGQLSAADLKNFETAIELYGKQAATVTGLPARYFGLHSANPPAEGAIYADEAQLVRSIEAQNDEVGTTLGWVGALALRFQTGAWVEGNRISVDWHNPATPTVAQRADAITKLKQSGILSREGAWDELGWSQARKDRERQYFSAEASDPELQVALGLLAGATE